MPSHIEWWWNMNINLIFHQSNFAHQVLAHWGRVTHMCVSNLVYLSAIQQLLVQIMACRLFGAKPLSEPMLELLTWPVGKNFIEIWIKILAFSFTKMCFKVSSAKYVILSRSQGVKFEPGGRYMPSYVWKNSATMCGILSVLFSPRK